MDIKKIASMMISFLLLVNPFFGVLAEGIENEQIVNEINGEEQPGAEEGNEDGNDEVVEGNEGGNGEAGEANGDGNGEAGDIDAGDKEELPVENDTVVVQAPDAAGNTKVEESVGSIHVEGNDSYSETGARVSASNNEYDAVDDSVDVSAKLTVEGEVTVKNEYKEQRDTYTDTGIATGVSASSLLRGEFF